MKNNDTNHVITRRDFIKLSGAAAAFLSVPNLPGCSSARIQNVPSIDYSRDLVIKNCTIIDVTSGRKRDRSAIHIRKGIIQSIYDGDSIPADAVVIDAAGTYAIPGLIDAHCHPTITSAFSVDTIDLSRHMAFQKRQFTIAAEYGITTYRDMGSFNLTLHGIIDDINNGKMIGPRVIYCNSLLNMQGGHPDIPPTDAHPLAEFVALFTGMVMTNFKDLDELKKILPKTARGASFIKLTMDNRSVFCKKEPIPVYSDEMLDYIFNYAREKGLPVSCHVHRKFGFDRALKYPINSLEHIVSDAYLDDRDIELMAKKNVSIVPTMTIGLAYMMEEAFDEIPVQFRNDFMMNELSIRREYMAGEAYKHSDPVIHKKNLEALKDYKAIGRDNLWKKKKFLVDPELYFGMVLYGTKSLMKMRSAGITIGLGIDAGMPLSYFGGLYREMEYLSRAGFKNDEILKIATINGARILGLQDRIGTLEKGKIADIVLLPTNPLTNVLAYRAPDLVIKEGRIIFSRNVLPVAMISGNTNQL